MTPLPGRLRRASSGGRIRQGQGPDTGQQFVEHRGVTPDDLAYRAWGFGKVFLSEDDPLLATALAVKALRYVVRDIARQDDSTLRLALASPPSALLACPDTKRAQQGCAFHGFALCENLR